MSRARRNFIRQAQYRPAPQPTPTPVQQAPQPVDERNPLFASRIPDAQTAPQPTAQPAPPQVQSQPAGGCACQGDKLGKYTAGEDGVYRKWTPPMTTTSYVPKLRRVFCHAYFTKVKMADGSLKLINDLKIGDEVLHGGKVLGKGDAFAELAYSYKGEITTGSHTVKENGKWITVAESKLARFAPHYNGVIVCPIRLENDVYETEAGYMSGDVSFEQEALKEVS